MLNPFETYAQLTSAELSFVQNLAGLSYAQGDLLYYNGSELTRLPAGTDGWFLKTQGAGANPTWVAVPGGGDVLKVGTPVNNQIGVWTGDGTIEGDVDLTFDTATNTLTLAGVGDTSILAVGGANILVDSPRGTMTLSNIDAIDATTETTLEAALDFAPVAHSHEGTAILSTGEVGGTKFLREDGDGTSSWQALPASGNVSKVGTPVDNQIGVWTGDGTIEGDAGFTFDGGLNITVADAENKVGLTITQNDLTNDPLGLAVNAGGSGAKVTSSTLVQYNATTGSNSDWSFNVANNGVPYINFQSTGGTLGTPTASSTGTASEIDTYIYNSANAQKCVSEIYTTVSDTTNGSEDAYISLRTIQGGTMIPVITAGSGINGIAVGASTATGVLSSNGNQDLILQTGNATTGNITITDGAAGQITIAPATTGVTQLYNADAGSTGAVLELYHDSASPATNDIIGKILFYGEDSASNKQLYGAIETYIDDTTSTSEDASLALSVVKAGTTGLGRSALLLNATAFRPESNDTIALGTTTAQFSDLFLAEGGVINWDNGDATLTQAGNVVTLAGADLTVPNITVSDAGAITLGENTSIDLDGSLSADGKYSGTCISGTAGAALAFGDVVYLAAADSRWELTDADAVGTAGTVLVGICVLAAAGDGSATKILLNGTIRADAKFPTFTVSAPVYIDTTTAGGVTTTAPTGADDVVRVLGFALTADSMYFNPSPDHITHTG